MKGIIRKKARIVRSRNNYLVGIEGKILDETRNMVLIGNDSKKWFVEKKICSFEIGGQVVEGRDILKKTKDRLKKSKRGRKRW